MSFSLEGKTVLVTGGANGLGRMIAEGLLRAGAELIITARREAESAAAELSQIGPCRGIAADLGSAERVNALVAAVGAATSHLHVLVNNAGRTWGAPLGAFPDEAWPKVMATNVHAPFALAQGLLPLLEAAGTADDPARIINIGSIAGIRVLGLSAYSYAASKAALHHVTRELAAELGARHIAVNSVLPGFFPTRMTADMRSDNAVEQAMFDRIPLGRLGKAQDIAGVITFLASPAAAYISGAEIVIDGGLSGTR